MEKTFKKEDRVVILSNRLEATVIDYYTGACDRVKVITPTGQEWLIRSENLAHLVEGQIEK